MRIEVVSEFCDNYFPPINIEVRNYPDNKVYNSTTYTEPSDGVYDSFLVGIFRVKYKKLNPNYYCAGQLDV